MIGPPLKVVIKFHNTHKTEIKQDNNGLKQHKKYIKIQIINIFVIIHRLTKCKYITSKSSIFIDL